MAKRRRKPKKGVNWIEGSIVSLRKVAENFGFWAGTVRYAVDGITYELRDWDFGHTPELYGVHTGEPYRFDKRVHHEWKMGVEIGSA